jgi:hypothetical protein
VIHLVNQSGARRKSFGPHLTITGGRLRLPGEGASGRPELLVSKATAEVRKDGDDLLISRPLLELFEVIRRTPGE